MTWTPSSTAVGPYRHHLSPHKQRPWLKAQFLKKKKNLLKFRLGAKTFIIFLRVVHMSGYWGNESVSLFVCQPQRELLVNACTCSMKQKISLSERDERSINRQFRNGINMMTPRSTIDQAHCHATNCTFSGVNDLQNHSDVFRLFGKFRSLLLDYWNRITLFKHELNV